MASLAVINLVSFTVIRLAFGVSLTFSKKQATLKIWFSEVIFLSLAGMAIDNVVRHLDSFVGSSQSFLSIGLVEI